MRAVDDQPHRRGVVRRSHERRESLHADGLSHARLVVVKSSVEEGKRFRRQLSEEVPRHESVEILAWPKDQFHTWLGAFAESLEVVGEAGGLSLNLVLNHTPIAVDLART